MGYAIIVNSGSFFWLFVNGDIQRVAISIGNRDGGTGMRHGNRTFIVKVIRPFFYKLDPFQTKFWDRIVG